MKSCEITTAVGERITIEAQLNSSFGVEDFLQWHAEEGVLEPLAAPRFGTTWRAAYDPPAEPGIYVVQALSNFTPQNFDAVRVIVTGEPKLVMETEAQFVLDGSGSSRRMEYTQLNADGSTISNPYLYWTSSNPEVVSVGSTGVVTAMSSKGSAILTGSTLWQPAGSEIEPLQVSVSVGSPADHTVILPDHSVLYHLDDRLLLDRELLPMSLQPGMIVITGEGEGAVGRITSLQLYKYTVLATYEPATLPEAFDALDLDIRGEPQKIVFTSDDFGGPGPLGETQKLSKSGFECEFDKGWGTVGSFDLGGLDVELDVAFGGFYRNDVGTPSTFELYLEGSASYVVRGSSLSVTSNQEISVDCFYLGEPEVLPAAPLGPMRVGPSVTPKLGVTLSGSIGGTVSMESPESSYTIDDLRIGFGWDGAGFYAIDERTVNEVETDHSGTRPIEVSAAASVTLSPYVTGIVGIGGQFATGPSESIDFMDVTAAAFSDITLSDPLFPSQQEYVGPEWAAGVALTATLNPLWENPFVHEFLGFLGGGHLDLEVIGSVEFTRWRSPELTLTSHPTPSQNPTHVTIVATSGGPAAASLAGRPARFLAWPAEGSNSGPTQIATGTVVQAGESEQVTATVPWPSETQKVAVRVNGGVFGAIGWPYGKGTITIGGDTPIPDCDGPECPPTSPGGPPGGPGGVGGGFGDPGDDGSPGEPGSIGGGGIGGSNGSGGDGGVTGGSGNNDGTSSSTGDPHIISLDGLRFNFQGAGEFILVGSLDENGAFDRDGDLQVQVRQAQVAPGVQGAINTGVGVRLGLDTVAIYATPEAGQSHLYLNGAALDLNGGSLTRPAGGIHHNGSSYTILWQDGSRLRVNLGYRHLDLALFLSDDRLDRAAGLMGVYDGDRANDFTTRGGVELTPPINFYELYDVLGESWRVPGNARLLDPSLGGGDPTDPNFPESFPDANITDEILDEAEARCVDGGVFESGVLLACRFDVAILLTADPVDEPLIASIIAGHAASQTDVFGTGDAEVFVVPANIQVPPAMTLSFTASVHGATNDQVVWETSAGSGEVHGNTLTWTAPDSYGPVTLTAISVADGTVAGTAQVEVVNMQAIVASSEYQPGWASHVLDSLKGECNDGEWATKGQPTGWIKLYFGEPTTISQITLFDRACVGEQVKAGRIKFSDASNDVMFGELENLGEVGTVLDFSPREVLWIEVVLELTETSATDRNPGLGEIWLNGSTPGWP